MALARVRGPLEFKALGAALNKRGAGRYIGTFDMFGEEVPYQVVACGDGQYALYKHGRFRRKEFAETLEPFRYRLGVLCPGCNIAIYSPHRHGFEWCNCKKTYVDGGGQYCRFGSEFVPTTVTIDLLLNRIKEDPIETAT